MKKMEKYDRLKECWDKVVFLENLAPCCEPDICKNAMKQGAAEFKRLLRWVEERHGEEAEAADGGE